MLASRALSILAQPDEGPSPDRPRHPILASIMPALDTAFGVEPVELFPDEIRALVDALTVALDAAAEETRLDFLVAA